jgi:hypothetical protein
MMTLTDIHLAMIVALAVSYILYLTKTRVYLHLFFAIEVCFFSIRNDILVAARSRLFILYRCPIYL